jgi:hypothetical protein
VLGLTAPAPVQPTPRKPARNIPASSDSRVDWFERLTGVKETGYAQTRQQLEVDGKQLRSRVNGQHYSIGQLELVSLGVWAAEGKTPTSFSEVGALN